MAFGESGPQPSIENVAQHTETVEHQEPLDVQGHLDAIKKDYGIDLPVDTFDNTEQLATIAEHLKQLKNNNPDVRDNIQDAVQSFVEDAHCEGNEYIDVNVALAYLCDSLTGYKSSEVDVARVSDTMRRSASLQAEKHLQDEYGLEQIESPAALDLDNLLESIKRDDISEWQMIKNNIQNAIQICKERE